MAKKKTAKKKTVKLLPQPESANIPERQIDMNPQNLIMSAVQSGASIDVLERLLSMRDRIVKEQAEIAFRESMSLFQEECPVIAKKKEVKNKDKTTTRYKYAPLDDIIKTVQPIITKHGFSYKIETKNIDEPFKGIESTVIISHVMGHSESTCFSVPIDSNEYMTEPQRYLSSQTFTKRVAFCNGFGIITGDTDDDVRQHKTITVDNQAIQKDMHDKLESLPEEVKTGLRILGYTVKVAYQFCDRFEWNHKKIILEINKIIDANSAGSK